MAMSIQSSFANDYIPFLCTFSQVFGNRLLQHRVWASTEWLTQLLTPGVLKKDDFQIPLIIIIMLV